MKPDLHQQFKDLIETHGDRIYRLCKSLLYKQSLVEDAYQEVMLNIWKSLPAFKGKSSLYTWIYRVTVNTTITFNKKEKRHISENDNTAPQLVTQEENPQGELLEQLWASIAKLQEPDKTIISLFLDEFSYKEIAEILHISTSNVGVRINRIKAKLSGMMQMP